MSRRVLGRVVNLAGDRATRALGGDADVVVQGQTVVGVFQDRREGLQEAARPVLNVEVLHVVADRQALALDDLRFPRVGEGFFPFLQAQPPGK